MDIKELLLEGCNIKMGYKLRLEDWVGDVTISIFSGGCGFKPKVCISGNINKDFKLKELDKAIAYFKSEVLSYNNLWYKHNEALRILAVDDPEIDLDVPRDYIRFAIKREQLARGVNI